MTAKYSLRVSLMGGDNYLVSHKIPLNTDNDVDRMAARNAALFAIGEMVRLAYALDRDPVSATTQSQAKRTSGC